MIGQSFEKEKERERERVLFKASSAELGGQVVAERPNTSKAARAARQRRNSKLKKSQLTRRYLDGVVLCKRKTRLQFRLQGIHLTSSPAVKAYKA